MPQGAPEVQRRGPGRPSVGGAPDAFARRQSASIRPGQGERRYQVFTDPAKVQLNRPEQRPVAQAQRVLRPVERRQERPQVSQQKEERGHLRQLLSKRAPGSSDRLLPSSQWSESSGR